MSIDAQRSDAALVDAARAGDKDAFSELVRRHGPLARQLALQMLGDRGLAEEAVQEGTLLAYLSLTRLRRPARFGPWLCGITLNLARRCLRERRRRIVASDASSEPQDAADVESAYETAELAAMVRGAVSRLAAGQRDATLLFYWQGLTHVEVAAELRISVGAVKNRLHQQYQAGPRCRSPKSAAARARIPACCRTLSCSGNGVANGCCRSGSAAPRPLRWP
ncbi:MAG: sigma-70 family RNA polymerase sigma factor [Pseudonocardiaceae bacterium]|nr:sigma-70 family RNA polymerase sigma factor [Pseudonocardiaceae bacterium]